VRLRVRIILIELAATLVLLPAMSLSPLLAFPLNLVPFAIFIVALPWFL